MIPIDLSGFLRIQGLSVDLGAYEASVQTVTYANWAAGHNLSGDGAMPSANPSGDGVRILIKYDLGLNPGASNLTLTAGVNTGLPQMEVSGERLTFTFIKDTAKSDLTYTIESTTD
jgi:hypothetical protein